MLIKFARKLKSASNGLKLFFHLQVQQRKKRQWHDLDYTMNKERIFSHHAKSTEGKQYVDVAMNSRNSITIKYAWNFNF